MFTVRMQKIQGYLRCPIVKTTASPDVPLGKDEIHKEVTAEWVNLWANSVELLADYMDTNWEELCRNVGIAPYDVRRAQKPHWAVGSPKPRKPRREALKAALARIRANP